MSQQSLPVTRRNRRSRDGPIGNRRKDFWNPGIAVEKRRLVDAILPGGAAALLAVGDSPADVPLWSAARVAFVVGARLDTAPIGVVYLTGTEDDLGLIEEALEGVA